MVGWGAISPLMNTLSIICIGLSIVTSALFLVSYASYERLRKFPSNLVMWMSVSGFFFSLALGMSLVGFEKYILPSTELCHLQGLFIHFFGSAMVFWYAPTLTHAHTHAHAHRIKHLHICMVCSLT
jgi:hypothetical protein